MPELTSEMIAERLGWTYTSLGEALADMDEYGDFLREWHDATGVPVELPNWLHDIEAALRDVWPALCKITPVPSHNWRLWLANTGQWVFHREDDEPTRWYRARSMPELATQICRAYMAYKEAPDAHT